MHQSGICVDDALKQKFSTFSADPNSLFLKVIIDDDNFVAQEAHVGKESSREEDFAKLQNVLEEKTPCYCLLRVSESKFVVAFYVPDNAPVRAKMVYASSTSSLKSGLGGSYFAEDWALSEKSECTVDNYEHSIKDEVEVLKSGNERLNEKTAYEVATMLSDTKVSAIVGIPIKIHDDTIAALKSIKDGSVTTAVLTLDPVTEVLNCEAPNNASVSEWTFPPKEPRYFVHNYKHEKDGEQKSKLIFVYYCPNSAIPKLKMFYSTIKSNIVTLFGKLEISDVLNYECNAADECTDELLMKEIYPPPVENRSFKKPTSRGRGKAKMTAKFSAS